MNKLKRWLYAFAIAIFSALLVAFAYDIEKGTSIGLSSTQAGRQEMLIFVAKFLGITGSWIVGILATVGSFWYTIDKYKNEKCR
jgi:hypothetical protein